MIVLDTNCLTLLERKRNAAYYRLRERLSKVSEAEVATTIACFEEQMRGWLAFIAKAKTLERQVQAYRELRMSFDNYKVISILDFDENAAVEFQNLQKLRLRVGTMDLKIAAVTLSQKAILVTRNLSDFEQVPNLRVEDRTK